MRNTVRPSLALAFVVVVVAIGSCMAQTYTSLHAFNGPEGKNSFATLAQGRDGNLYGTASAGGANNMGVVFRIDTAGNYKVLHNFSGTDGNMPEGGLTLGPDGYFYGTTFLGGSSNQGLIYKMTPGGALTVLVNLGGAVGATYPAAPPIFGADGNIYGNTQGQAFGSGQLYKIDKAGSFSVLLSTSNLAGPLVQTADGFFYLAEDYNPGAVTRVNASGTVSNTYYLAQNASQGAYPSGVSLGPDGNVYGVASEGGLGNSGGVLFRLDKKFNYTVLYNFSSHPNDGRTPANSPLAANDGKLYGTTYFDGAYGAGIIYSYAPDGTVTTLWSFNNPNARTSPIGQPLQHTDGKFYGTTLYGGPRNQNGEIYSLDTGLTPFIALVTNTGKVGSTFQILGQGFTGTTAVNFTGASATFSVGADTFITGTVPAGAQSGPVEVTTPSGIRVSNRNFYIKP